MRLLRQVTRVGANSGPLVFLRLKLHRQKPLFNPILKRQGLARHPMQSHIIYA